MGGGEVLGSDNHAKHHLGWILSKDRPPTKQSEIILIHQLGLKKVKSVNDPVAVNYTYTRTGFTTC